jgi:hypothetical protein
MILCPEGVTALATGWVRIVLPWSRATELALPQRGSGTERNVLAVAQ